LGVSAPCRLLRSGAQKYNPLQAIKGRRRRSGPARGGNGWHWSSDSLRKSLGVALWESTVLRASPLFVIHKAIRQSDRIISAACRHTHVTIHAYS